MEIKRKVIDKKKVDSYDEDNLLKFCFSNIGRESMTKETYDIIEEYMMKMMPAPAHDSLHMYRVLNYAMKIAESYNYVDRDVLIASCLLHDIGRQAECENPNLSHAVEGSNLAYRFMKKLGWEEEKCQHIKECIKTHSYRIEDRSISMEAKILFDADKLDVTGAVGIARTLIYKGEIGEPIYTTKNGKIQDGSEPDSPDSFLKECQKKLLRIYDRFYTEEASRIALERKKITETFYGELLKELNSASLKGYESEI